MCWLYGSSQAGKITTLDPMKYHTSGPGPKPISLHLVAISLGKIEHTKWMKPPAQHFGRNDRRTPTPNRRLLGHGHHGLVPRKGVQGRHSQDKARGQSKPHGLTLHGETSQYVMHVLYVLLAANNICAAVGVFLTEPLKRPSLAIPEKIERWNQTKIVANYFAIIVGV